MLPSYFRINPYFSQLYLYKNVPTKNRCASHYRNTHRLNNLFSIFHIIYSDPLHPIIRFYLYNPFLMFPINLDLLLHSRKQVKVIILKKPAKLLAVFSSTQFHTSCKCIGFQHKHPRLDSAGQLAMSGKESLLSIST